MASSTPDNDTTATASAVPLPVVTITRTSPTETAVTDDLLSPLVESTIRSNEEDNIKDACELNHKNKNHTKTKKKRRRRRQSICFNSEAMAELSESRSPAASSTATNETHLEINKVTYPTAEVSIDTAPCLESSLETVLASPIVDFSEIQPTALGDTDAETATISTGTVCPPSTATKSTNTDAAPPAPTLTTKSSTISRARGPTGRLMWQAAVHRAKFIALTTKVDTLQARVCELELRLEKAEACNKRIVTESAEVVYARDELAQALRLAQASLDTQNKKEDDNSDGEKEDNDATSLLSKLKRAEKKIATLIFENEMTMQEMAQQADSFEEEMEQETLARDIDIRAAETKVEEALKENAQLKAQMDQVQLKFTGALKQALARNAELSSQLAAAKMETAATSQEE